MAIKIKVYTPQDSGICRVPDFDQHSDFRKNRSLIDAKKRLDLDQDIGEDPDLQEHPSAAQNPGSHRAPAPGQGSRAKPPGPAQQDCPSKDSGPNEKTGFAPGMDSAQVLGPLQTLMLSSSPVKSFACRTASQKDNAERHASIPASQNSCPSKAQVMSTDLKTFSEVPVLIELHPPSRQLGSQDWVYHTADTVPLARQKHRQTSAPPKANWKPHCPGPGTRTGHVVFDSSKKPSVTGRKKCEALAPRRMQQEAPRSSEETKKEWGYQGVMRALNEQRANVRWE